MWEIFLLRLRHLACRQEDTKQMTISIGGLNISPKLDAYIPNLSNHSSSGVYAVYFWGRFQA